MRSTSARTGLIPGMQPSDAPATRMPDFRAAVTPAAVFPGDYQKTLASEIPIFMMQG